MGNVLATAGLKPSEVFVPGRLPVEETNAYADRGAPQKDAARALERGFVPLVFGGYGVGKSSLVMRMVSAMVSESQVVYVENVFQKSLEDVFKAILEKIGYEVTVQRASQRSNGASTTLESEVEGGVFGLLRAKLRGSVSLQTSNGESQVSELVVSSPTESKLIDICEEKGLVLVIDELHRANETMTESLGAFLKAYANRNCRRFKIALLGTENEASRLVISDPGTDRIIEEVHLPPLKEEEALAIIGDGFSRLEIDVTRDARDALVTYSVGSPFVLQFLCLEVTEMSCAESRRAVTKEDVRAALDDYARRKAQRLIRVYRATIETTGYKRYRKQILAAMASSPDEYVTMDYLVDKISDALGETVPSTTLSGPLRQLKTEEYSRILRDVENPAGGGRLGNYSAFTDPAMKAIIRMVESGGLHAT